MSENSVGNVWQIKVRENTSSGEKVRKKVRGWTQIRTFFPTFFSSTVPECRRLRFEQSISLLDNGHRAYSAPEPNARKSCLIHAYFMLYARSTTMCSEILL